MSFKPGAAENSSQRFPWYKERLKTKYLRDLSKSQQLSGALDGRKWRFLAPGLDDFRDGYPTVRQELFIQCKCGTSPVVFGVPSHGCLVKLPQKRLSKEQACYSKQNPQTRAQREFIDAVEHRLKQHPLALYPHLQTAGTPELFDEVLSVLDPDMCVKGELTTTSPTKQMEQLQDSGAQCESSDPKSCRETVQPRFTTKSQREKCKDSRPTNPYKWKELKEICVKEDQMASVKHLHSLSPEDDKLAMTKLLCEWVTSLGGETNDLTESAILDLFKSDYEKKSSLTFPNNEIDSNKIPAKLYSSAENLHRDQSLDTCFNVTKLNKACKPNRPQNSKTRRRAANKSQRSPSDITENLEFEEDLSEQDKELKQIHSIQAFREFIISKGKRMPRFLSALFSEEEQKNRIRGSDTAGSTSAPKARMIQ